VTSKTAGLPAKVTFKVVADETTAANLLTTGGVDMALITRDDVTRLLADASLNHKEAHSFYAFPVVVNVAAGHPGVDPVLRQALFEAIDPKGYNPGANGDCGVLSSSFLTPDANCYDSITKSLAPVHSVDKAKATLTARGYSVGVASITKDGKPVNLVVTERPDFKQGPDDLNQPAQRLMVIGDGGWAPGLGGLPGTAEGCLGRSPWGAFIRLPRQAWHRTAEGDSADDWSPSLCQPASAIEPEVARRRDLVRPEASERSAWGIEAADKPLSYIPKVPK
jgi:hypothetical protein